MVGHTIDVPVRLEVLWLAGVVPSRFNKITQAVFIAKSVNALAVRECGQVGSVGRICFSQSAFHGVRRALMGSDTLAPSFIDNVFDMLEIAGAQRRDVAGRTIDGFGEPRQFDLLVLGKQI